MFKIVSGGFYDTYNLIDVLNKLAKKPIKIYDVDDQTFVRFKEIISWRGSYRNLAGLIDKQDYDHNINELIDKIKDADGKIVEGYKGGFYKLSLNDLIRFEYSEDEYENKIPFFIAEFDDYYVLFIGKTTPFFGEYGKRVELYEEEEEEY